MTKGRFPMPVYVATLANGEVARLSFWQPVGKPLDIARGRYVASYLCGAESFRGRYNASVPVADKIPAKIIAGHVEYDGAEYADPMTDTYAVWPVGERAKVAKPSAKGVALRLLRLLKTGLAIPADIRDDLERLAA